MLGTCIPKLTLKGVLVGHIIMIIPMLHDLNRA